MGGAFKTTPTAGAVTTLRGIRRVMTYRRERYRLSATDAWRRAVVGDAPDLSIITRIVLFLLVALGLYLPLLLLRDGPRVVAGR
jgi:hypothetical protein